jgi:Fe-S-cluster containining protein
MTDVDINESPIPKSPVIPKLYEGDTVIQFRCHKDIACFNACCSNIDISLAPYDIVRLKNRLGMNSSEFLVKYAVPYELEKDGIAGVKLRPVENGTACQFMTDEGCSVYEDRPTACRYYPVGQVALRKQDEYTDHTHYALVKEEHCLGHQEDRSLTIDEYREEQGLLDYDEYDRGWRQLILKKKSSGPAIGKPSLRSRQLFFMACYDLDRFRLFVTSEAFKESFALDDETWEKIDNDEVELLQFAFRFLRQVLFGEESIPLSEAAQKAKEAQLEQQRQEEEAPKEYDPSREPVDI